MTSREPCVVLDLKAGAPAHILVPAHFFKLIWFKLSSHCVPLLCGELIVCAAWVQLLVRRAWECPMKHALSAIHMTCALQCLSSGTRSHPCQGEGSAMRSLLQGSMLALIVPYRLQCGDGP